MENSSAEYGIRKGVIVYFKDENALSEPPAEVLAERFHILQDFFQPILIPQEKPLYLKPDEWAVRKKRFDS